MFVLSQLGIGTDLVSYCIDWIFKASDSLPVSPTASLHSLLYPLKVLS